MKILLPKWRGGISLAKVSLRSKMDHRKMLLEDPQVIELMRIAFMEGGIVTADFNTLIKNLKR